MENSEAEDDTSEALDEIVAEARWPMATAVLVTMGLTLALPRQLHFLPRWVLPALEAALLVAIVLGDPGGIDRRARWLRTLSIALVALLVVSALWATALLIDALIDGSSATASAGQLLATGAAVWITNILAFALLYWELDDGGAAARFHASRTAQARRPLDLAFPQHMNPELAPAGWRPLFLDYLYLGFTNATAFSPTDAMPLRPWAKVTMATQASISLALLGLVIARAVNVFA